MLNTGSILDAALVQVRSVASLRIPALCWEEAKDSTIHVLLMETTKCASGPSSALPPVLQGRCIIPIVTQRGQAVSPRSHSC